MVLNLGTAEFGSRLNLAGVNEDLARFKRELQRTRTGELYLRPTVRDRDLQALTRSLTQSLTGRRGFATQLGQDMGRELVASLRDQITDSLRSQRRRIARVFEREGQQYGDAMTSAIRGQLDESLGDAITDSLSDSRRRVERASEQLASQSADAFVTEYGGEVSQSIGESVSDAILDSRRDVETSSERLAREGADFFVTEYEIRLSRLFGDAVQEAIATARREVESSSELLGRQGADSFATEYEDRTRRILPDNVQDAIRSIRDEVERQAATEGRRAGDSFSDAFESSAKTNAPSIGGQVGQQIGGSLSTNIVSFAAITGANFVAGLATNMISSVASLGLDLGRSLFDGIVEGLRAINDFVINLSQNIFAQVSESVRLGASVNDRLIRAEVFAATPTAEAERQQVGAGGTFGDVREEINRVANDRRFVVGPVDLAESTELLARAGRTYREIEQILESVGAAVTVTDTTSRQFTQNYLDFTSQLRVAAENQQEVLALLIGASSAANVEVPEIARGGRFFTSQVQGIEGARQTAELLALSAAIGVTGSTAGTQLSRIINRQNLDRAIEGTSTISPTLPNLQITQESFDDQVELLRQIIAEYQRGLIEAQQLGDDAVNDFEVNFERAFGVRGTRLLRPLIDLFEEDGEVDRILTTVRSGQSTLDDLFAAYDNRVGIGFNAIENSLEAARLRISDTISRLFDIGGVEVARFLDDVFTGVSTFGDNNPVGLPPPVTGIPARGEPSSGFGFLTAQIEALEATFRRDEIAAQLRRLATVISDFARSSLDVLGYAVSQIRRFFASEENARQFVDTIQFVLGIVRDFARTVVDVYAQLFGRIFDVLNQARTQGETFREVAIAIARELGRNVAEVADEFAPFIAEFIRVGFSATGSVIRELFTFSNGPIAEIGRDLGRAFNPLIDPLRDLFVNNGPQLVAGLEALWDILINLLEPTSQLVGIGIRLIDGVLQLLLPLVSTLLVDLSGAVALIRGAVGPAFTFLDELLNNTNVMLANFLRPWGQLNLALNDAVQSFNSVITAAQNWLRLDLRRSSPQGVIFSDADRQALMQAEETMQAFADRLGNYWNRLTTDIGNFFTNLFGWFRRGGDEGQLFGQRVGDAFAFLEPTLDAISRFFGFGGDTPTALEPGGDGVLVASTDLSGLLAAGTRDVDEFTQGPLKRLYDGVASLFEPLPDVWRQWQEFRSDVAADAERLQLQLNERVNAVKDFAIAAIIETVTSWIDNGQQAWDFLRNVTAGILDEFIRIRDGAIALFENLVAQLVELGRRGNQALSGFAETLGLSFENVIPILERLAGFINAISGATAGFARSVADTFTDLRDATERSVGGVIGGITNAASTILPVTARIVGTETRNSPWAPVTERNPHRVFVSGRLIDMDELTREFIPVADQNRRAYYESLLTNDNVRRFLDLIAYAEGADYNVLFGGSTFNDFSRHPDRVISAGGYSSSAAGRYQFLTDTWLGVANSLGLTDFSPRNQDIGAISLLDESGALDRVLSGAITEAINRSAPTWASLPDSSGRSVYGQPVRGLNELLSAFNRSPGASGVTAGGFVSPIAGQSLRDVIDYQQALSQDFDAFRAYRNGFHAGVDFDSRIGAGQGGRIQSIFGGTIRSIDSLFSNAEGPGGSQRVIVATTDNTGREILAEYTHLSRASVRNAGLSVGQQVAAGQLLGSVGSTDSVSSGPHLDLKIRVNGQYVDPDQFLSLGGRPGSLTTIDVSSGRLGQVSIGQLVGALGTALRLGGINISDQVIAELIAISSESDQGFQFNIPSLDNDLALLMTDQGDVPALYQLPGRPADLTNALETAFGQLETQQQQVEFETADGEQISFVANQAATELRDFLMARGLTDNGRRDESDTRTELEAYRDITNNLVSSIDPALLSTLHNAGVIAPGAVHLGLEFKSAQGTTSRRLDLLGNLATPMQYYDPFVGNDLVRNMGYHPVDVYESFTESGVLRDVRRRSRNRTYHMAVRGIEPQENYRGEDILKLIDAVVNNPDFREDILADTLEHLEYDVTVRDRIGLTRI